MATRLSFERLLLDWDLIKKKGFGQPYTNWL